MDQHPVPGTSSKTAVPSRLEHGRDSALNRLPATAFRTDAACGPSGAGQCAIPVRPAAHLARRPEWDCAVCGQQWPCRPGQADLLAQYADDRVGLLVYLAGLLVDAVQEIPGPPDRLLDRFLRWAKISESR